jgi:hypothetical protein
MMFLAESKEKMQVWLSSLNPDFVFCGQRASWMTPRPQDLETGAMPKGHWSDEMVVEPRGYRFFAARMMTQMMNR